MQKKGTSFRLSPEALQMLKTLSEEHGLSQAGYLEMLLRQTMKSAKRK